MNPTRRFVLASATAGLVPSSFASELAVDEKVVAVAKYGGRDVAWEIALTAKYTAKFKAEINGGPTGSIAGDFRFYDTDILEKEEMPRFLKLPKTFFAPRQPIHPWAYVIALRNPETMAFHEVSVWFGNDMPRSADLQFFFEVWRNIWSGVPGYPRVPESYAG